MDRAVLGTTHPYPGEVPAAALHPVLSTPAPPENLTNVTRLSPAGTLPGESSWAPGKAAPMQQPGFSLGNKCLESSQTPQHGLGRQRGLGPLKTNMAR